MLGAEADGEADDSGAGENRADVDADLAERDQHHDKPKKPAADGPEHARQSLDAFGDGTRIGLAVARAADQECFKLA